MKPVLPQLRNFSVVTLFVLMLQSCGEDPGRKNLAKEPSSVVTSHADTAVEKPKDAAVHPAPKVVQPSAVVGDFYFISLKNKDSATRIASNKIIKDLSASQRAIVFRLNRVDAASYKRLDTMVIPKIIDTVWMNYTVFPATISSLKDVRKMVIFSYYAEAFAAYENGQLQKWGPTSMGKKSTPTPTGLFSANWKAKETVSTVDDEWILKWNFNIWNKGGVGWHQYQMPGIPASHSCIRLLESDAMWLYNFADMWILDGDLLAAQGTPVLVFGKYPFGKSKPWWSLVENPTALNIPEDSLNAILAPLMPKIMSRQTQRDSLLQAKAQAAKQATGANSAAAE